MTKNSKPSGTLYVVSAPSGGGKTSLVTALTAKDKNIQVSVSVTTRPKRPGEKKGKSYCFVTDAKFNTLIEKNTFLEHACVFGYQYGTSRKAVEKMLSAGKDVILEIDWQGALQVKQIMPHGVSIFILPPSMTTLRKRLKERGQDSEAVIKRRVQEAREEISHYPEYDYLIVNDVFEEALASLRAIIQAKRLNQSHQQNVLSPLLKKLVSKKTCVNQAHPLKSMLTCSTNP